jgi:hypothetical protein
LDTAGIKYAKRTLPYKKAMANRMKKLMNACEHGCMDA